MRLWPVAAGLAAGLLAGAIWTWAQGDRFRADARLLVRPASATVMPAVETLAESSVVESNVAQTLRLSSPPTISARRGDGGVLTVSTEAGTRERARQVDAEALVVLAQRVSQRFPRVSMTVLDPAHAAEQTSPTTWRNLLVAGAIGLAAGLAAAASRREPSLGPSDPRVERRLRKRIDEVAKRERALARRAGELAAREQALAGRPAVGAVPPPPPPPEAEPEPAAAPPPAARVPGSAFNIADLEARAADSGAGAEQRDEWQTYLFFLRQHAQSDGTLPSQFDALVLDVFGELL